MKFFAVIPMPDAYWQTCKRLSANVVIPEDRCAHLMFDREPDNIIAQAKSIYKLPESFSADVARTYWA